MTLLQRILLYVCAVLLLVPPVIAQVNDASLTGIVADQSQAAVANATVTARNQATNFTQVVQSDASGYYSFLSLPIGSYVVTVKQTGFEPVSAEILLQTAQKARHDFSLKVGESKESVVAVHVDPGEHSELLRAAWERYVEGAFREAGDPVPKLLTLPSPYRFIIVPIVQYILQLSEKHPERRIVVVIPELVEGRWYEYFRHNQRGRLLAWMLLVRGNERIFTVSAPYYLADQHTNSVPGQRRSKHALTR